MDKSTEADKINPLVTEVYDSERISTAEREKDSSQTDMTDDTEIRKENESSMDGLFSGKTFKRILGVGKSSSQTYTAKVIPAEESIATPQHSIFTDVASKSDVSATGTSNSTPNKKVGQDAMPIGASCSSFYENMQEEPNNTVSDHGLSIGEKFSLSVPSHVISCNTNNKKPGLALIITGQNFSKGLGGYRIGAEEDLKNMFDLFTNLNFEVQWRPFVDRETKDLKDELIKCANDPRLEQKECLVIVISSHGGEIKLGRPYRPVDIPSNMNVYSHAITTYDGFLLTSEIMDIFDDDNCSYLEGKPRILFVQACRSRSNVKKIDKGFDLKVANVPLDSSGKSSSMDIKHATDLEMNMYKTPERTDLLITPCYENYMVVFASTSEHVGWSENDGGVLLTALYKVFKDKITQKQEIDVLPTMAEVCNKMMEWESNFSDARYDKAKSTLSLVHMLQQNIIFKSGNGQ